MMSRRQEGGDGSDTSGSGGVLDDVPLPNETFRADEMFESGGVYGDILLSGDALVPQVKASFGPDSRVLAQSASPPDAPEVCIPLSKWIQDNRRLSSSVRLNKMTVIRKTTVAYAIAELLQYLKKNHTSSLLDDETVHADNFIIRVANEFPDANIDGVSMISPAVSLRVITPFFSSDEFFNGEAGSSDGTNQEELLGQFLEVEITTQLASSAEPQFGSGKENKACHLFGVLLHRIYSGSLPERHSQCTSGDSVGNLHPEDEPSRKRVSTLSFGEESGEATHNDGKQPTKVGSNVAQPSDYTPLMEFGYPSSLSLLVKNAIDCGWEEEFLPDKALPSLKAVSSDLHLLLLDPDRFLFDPSFVQGREALDIKENKVYGRDAEQSLISDAFCRVSLTGNSEALFIGGFSGSGKSKLVHSVVGYVDVAGGYTIQGKFDQISHERPISVVIAAFDEICSQMSRKNSPQQLKDIVSQLVDVFGVHLSALAQLLPSVSLLSPKLTWWSTKGSDSEINLNSVTFILQLFTRVVSSKTHPIMLFLDDLHWADRTSLDVLRSLVIDTRGTSCIYLVCSYRSNEVPKCHGIFGLMDSLEKSNVRSKKIALDGLAIEEVNRIVSDALGLFPRICEPLTQIIMRKTKGNPLFVLECLKSLVDRDLVKYSLRDRSWVWDTDTIAAEDISDNVCDLFSTKMISLPEKTQVALKVAACFGTNLPEVVVSKLVLASDKLSSFQEELEKAVVDGFMIKKGSTYRFSHDKVREASYGLIQEGERDEFHQKIGTLLYQSTVGTNIDDIVFFICDQINHGTIQDYSQRIRVAGLNHKAASKAMRASNFAAAHFYSNAAMKLLPDDHWESHFELSKNIFLVYGNAAYVEGHTKQALRALDSILDRGNNLLSDKLDAYYLKIALQPGSKQSYHECLAVLKELGENIPAKIYTASLNKRVGEYSKKLTEMLDTDFAKLKTLSGQNQMVLKFYDQLCYLSYFEGAPIGWYACRMIEITLEHGFCKYSASGIMRFAVVVAGKQVNDLNTAAAVGKMALKMLVHFDATDLLPSAYMCYYGYIVVDVEPFQSCADMLKRGFKMGLATGQSHVSFSNAAHYIQKSFLGGMNLPLLKQECDYCIRVLDANSLPVSKMYLMKFQQTISVVMNKWESPIMNESDHNAPHVNEFTEAALFHGAMQNFWMGHYNRCAYFAEKFVTSTSGTMAEFNKIKGTIVLLYGGLSCFHRDKVSSKKNMKLARQAIEVLKEKGEKASWNNKNKIHLLEAEIASIADDREKAKLCYNAAISGARSSRFIHEEGLACEFAALHCMKHGNDEDAKGLLQQALVCYTKWGSEVRVNLVQKHMGKLLSTLPEMV